MGKMTEDQLGNYRMLTTTVMPIWKSGDIKVLMNHVDAIEAEKDKLIDNVAQLNKELQQEREGKKVALPKEVAAAVEWFREQSLSNEEIYELSTNDDGGKYASILYKWSDTGLGDGNILMQALVNGYTIEEPTMEEKIEARLAKELERSGIDTPIPLSHFANQLTLAVREVLAEDKQHD